MNQNMNGVHPITREIKRQIKQGYSEKKEGSISKHFHFQMDYKGLYLKHDRAVYRIKKAGDSFSIDGYPFLDLPVSRYVPFRKLVNRLVPLLGSNGKSMSAKFKETNKDGEQGWEWELSEDSSLEEALANYRYGEFRYLASNGRELNFSPSHDPFENFGEISVEIPFKGVKNADIKTIDSLAKCLERL